MAENKSTQKQTSNAGQRKPQNKSTSYKDNGPDFATSKEALIVTIGKLDEASRDDRKTLNIIQNSARIGEMGIKYEAAGTLAVNFNAPSIKDIIMIAMKADSVMRDISDKVSSTNYKNEISFLNNDSGAKQIGVAMETQLKELASKFESIINTAHAAGYGMKRDVEIYKKELIRNSREKIAALIKAGKGLPEISETLSIEQQSLQGTYNNLAIEYVNESKADIEKMVDARKTLDEVAKKLKIEPERVSKLYNAFEKTFYANKKEEILKSIAAGKTVEEVAVELKLNGDRLVGLVANWKGSNKLKEVVKALPEAEKLPEEEVA